jgi:hypothetical protein
MTRAYDPSDKMPYVTYNNKNEVQSLNLNDINFCNAHEFPLDLYKGEPFNLANFLCDRPRDLESNYIFGTERFDHPDHFSRYAMCTPGNGQGFIFGYAYGNGFFGKYPTTIACWPRTGCQPSDMAPKRFYKDKFQTPCYNIGQTYKDSEISRARR